MPSELLITDNIFQALYELLAITMFHRFPFHLRIWIGILVSANMAGVFFWNSSLEGKVVPIIFNLGAFWMSALYQRYGFVKLLGLAHSFWLIMVPWLAFYRLPLLLTEGPVPESSSSTALVAWVLSVVAFDSLSLVLDVKDVYQYFFEGKTKVGIVWKENKQRA